MRKHFRDSIIQNGYFVLLNGPNWEVTDRIPIFGVILVKIWVIDPPGSPYIVLPPAVWQLILEEILTCFVINVFLWIFCIIKWSKLGGY